MDPWRGLSYQLNYVVDEFEMICRLVPGVEGAEEFRAALKALTRQSNERLLSLVERFADFSRLAIRLRPMREKCAAIAMRASLDWWS